MMGVSDCHRGVSRRFPRKPADLHAFGYGLAVRGWSFSRFMVAPEAFWDGVEEGRMVRGTIAAGRLVAAVGVAVGLIYALH